MKRHLCCDRILNHYPFDDDCYVTHMEEKVYLRLSFLHCVWFHRADLPLFNTDQVRPRRLPTLLLLACPDGPDDDMALCPRRKVLV